MTPTNRTLVVGLGFIAVVSVVIALWLAAVQAAADQTKKRPATPMKTPAPMTTTAAPTTKTPTTKTPQRP